SGIPSNSTLERLVALAPTPLSDTPCEDGFANKLLDLRNVLNPGTSLSTSSSTRLPATSICSAGIAYSLVGTAGMRSSTLDFTCKRSMFAAGVNTICTFCTELCGFTSSVAAANPGKLMRKVPPFPVSAMLKLPLASVFARITPSGERYSICAPSIPDPVESATVPRNPAPTCGDARHTTAVMPTKNAAIRHTCNLNCRRVFSTNRTIGPRYGTYSVHPQRIVSCLSPGNALHSG